MHVDSHEFVFIAVFHIRFCRLCLFLFLLLELLLCEFNFFLFFDDFGWLAGLLVFLLLL